MVISCSRGETGEWAQAQRNRLRMGMLVGLCAQALLATATMIGSASFAAVRMQFVDVMTGTHAGRALLCNGVVSLLLLAMVPVRRLWNSRIGTAFLLTVFATLAATRAATGHPAADGDFTLPELVQFVHLASIAIWSGGVIAAGFFVLPELLRMQQIEAVAQFGRRLSNTVTVAVLLIVLTGLYNSYRGLGGSLSSAGRDTVGRFAGYQDRARLRGSHDGSIQPPNTARKPQLFVGPSPPCGTYSATGSRSDVTYPLCFRIPCE